HKIYGPKGIGVLYVKNGTPWIPWLQGGSQERRRRGGTSNVAGIVGLSTALEFAVNEMDKHLDHFKMLRETVIKELNQSLKDRYLINGPNQGGVPHIINLGFPTDLNSGLDGEMLLLNLDIEGICVSNGSACTSGAMEPSHVLKGIEIPDPIAKSSVRISFGKQNTKEDVLLFVEKLGNILDRMTNVPTS
ncbi:MAG: aminotransferase class V-fold PLP-dependent enzyme, partial [Balneolaceae bacterium]